MRRRTLYALTALLVPMSMLFGVGEASAQTNGDGSTIGPCATTNNTFNLGTYNVGDVINARIVPLCVFDVGATVTAVVNGQSVGTKVADATGGINVSITILSTTQLSVDDPILVGAQCGANSVSASGVSGAAQSNVTATGIFTIACPTTAAAAAVSKGGLAFTGADILGLVALALALVAVGAVVVRLVRRRRGAGTTA